MILPRHTKENGMLREAFNTDRLDMPGLCAFADARETHCVLLLHDTAEGLIRIDTLQAHGKCTALRVCRSLTAAVRAAGELYLRTAAPRHQKVRIAFAADELWQAAKLAGRLDTDVVLLPLEGTQARLALLYTGTIRTAPLV